MTLPITINIPSLSFYVSNQFVSRVDVVSMGELACSGSIDSGNPSRGCFWTLGESMGTESYDSPPTRQGATNAHSHSGNYLHLRS